MVMGVVTHSREVCRRGIVSGYRRGNVIVEYSRVLISDGIVVTERLVTSWQIRLEHQSKRFSKVITDGQYSRWVGYAKIEGLVTR